MGCVFHELSSSETPNKAEMSEERVEARASRSGLYVGARTLSLAFAAKPSSRILRVDSGIDGQGWRKRRTCRYARASSGSERTPRGRVHLWQGNCHPYSSGSHHGSSRCLSSISCQRAGSYRPLLQRRGWTWWAEGRGCQGLRPALISMTVAVSEVSLRRRIFAVHLILSSGIRGTANPHHPIRTRPIWHDSRHMTDGWFGVIPVTYRTRDPPIVDASTTGTVGLALSSLINRFIQRRPP